MQHERYVFDVLYGRILLPTYVWEVLPSPELQRLREIRLCNINSLCLTGGANINRYEHAIGTSHLARQCLTGWPRRPSLDDERVVVLAALLHDIGSSAFGHSVQYIIDRAGFEHESVGHVLTGVDNSAGFSYQKVSLESVFFGMPKHLHLLLDEGDRRAIDETISGEGEYGPLISAAMDLDNIDNVFRLAYHMGLCRDTETPLQLARSMRVESGEVLTKREAIPHVMRWWKVRKRLYEFLLLNPDEFSAKCMLEQAIAQGAADQQFRWHLVDFELLERVATISADLKGLASRLMVGNLYGCLGIYESADISGHDRLAPGEERRRLEEQLSLALRDTEVPRLGSAVARIHTIYDVNKTEREIWLKTEDGDRVAVGTSTRRLLVGVFLENKHLSMGELPGEIVGCQSVQWAVRRELEGVLGPVKSLPLYHEQVHGSSQWH